MKTYDDHRTGGQGAPHLLYIADPMCSWCYGFAPVITAITDHFVERRSSSGDEIRSKMSVRVLVGGLRAGNTRRMRQTDKDFLRGAWTRVAAATGQPFAYSFFDREGFVYDTEPACRAVVAMREQSPEAVIGYMTRISRAFYAENRDTTSLDVLADLATEFGQDRDGFHHMLADPGLKDATMRDFVAVSEAGIQGFPTRLASGTGRTAVGQLFGHVIAAHECNRHGQDDADEAQDHPEVGDDAEDQHAQESAQQIGLDRLPGSFERRDAVFFAAGDQISRCGNNGHHQQAREHAKHVADGNDDRPDQDRQQGRHEIVESFEHVRDLDLAAFVLILDHSHVSHDHRPGQQAESDAADQNDQKSGDDVRRGVFLKR